MNNQRDINKTIARAILPIVAVFAMAAAVCPTSKEASVPCCSTITADPNTKIVVPEGTEPFESYACVQITCDNKDKKPQRCIGPMSKTVRCQELDDWVIKTYKRLTKNGSDCVLPVVGKFPMWVECPSTTSPEDATCDRIG